MIAVTTGNYKSDSVKGIRNRVLQKALANLQNRFGKGTAEAYRRLPEGPDLRLKAHDIRKESIENLDILLEMLSEKIRAKGGHVFFAADAGAAVDYCLNVARRNRVRLVVKGKSKLIRRRETFDDLVRCDLV